MTGALLLFALAGGLMAAGQTGLARAAWPHRSPRLAIVAWQALAAGVVGSLILGSLALALPGLSAASTVGELLRACMVELRRQYTHLEGAAVTSVGIGLLLLLVTRIAAALVRGRIAAGRVRQSHLADLKVIAEEMEGGVYLVETSSAAVYCVPRSRRRLRDAVVVTRGATQALTAQQMESVLRHERAHLSSRHDRLIGRADALARALPWLPFFRVAHEQIACLAEMDADDAVPVGDRSTLADALYRLSAFTHGAPSAAGGLAAAGSSTALRVRRLLGPQAPLRRSGVAMVTAGILGIAVAPAVLALVPTGLQLSHGCCSGALNAASTPRAPLR